MLTQYDTMPLNELTTAIEDLNVLQNVVWCYNRLLIGTRYAKNFDIIVSFGYKAHWDCLSYAKIDGKYCIHLSLEEIDL